VWRAVARLDAVQWARLAAAITFTSFVALFPLITVGAAIGAALLSEDQLGKLQDKIAAQAPGLTDLLNLNGLVAHAGTVGLIAGALLLVVGVNWVGALRGCLRAVWEKEQDPGNPFLLRLKDAGVLVGLGVVGLVALGSSVFANSAVGWAADRVGLARIPGSAPRSATHRGARRSTADQQYRAARTAPDGESEAGQGASLGRTQFSGGALADPPLAARIHDCPTTLMSAADVSLHRGSGSSRGADGSLARHAHANCELWAPGSSGTVWCPPASSLSGARWLCPGEGRPGANGRLRQVDKAVRGRARAQARPG
jgi:hypothetical protein